MSIDRGARVNSRERVNRAIEFGNPDRVPVMHAVLPAAYFVHGQALVDLLNEFPNDFGVTPTIPSPDEIYAPYRAGPSSPSPPGEQNGPAILESTTPICRSLDWRR